MTSLAESAGVGRPRSIFLSLLPPSDFDRRIALTVIVLSTAVFIALAPFAKEPLSPLPPFIPAYQSALLFSELMTAAVLYGQYAIQRTRGLLVVSAAYLFSALCVVPHTLSFPGLFGTDGLIGAGPQTTVWLYMLWHAGFPLLMIGYALVKNDGRTIAATKTWGLISVAAVAGIVAAGTLLTTRWHPLLPTLLLPDNTYTPAMSALILTVWLIGPVAALLLWLRRPHATLDLWLMVVMVVWTCDVGLSAALNARRFDLGFYAGRMYGLVAAGFVLVMLLLETRALYTRLAANLAGARRTAERELQRSQELYRTLFETNPYAVSVTDRETQEVLAVNEAAVALYGRSRDELLALHVQDFIAPDDLPLVLARRREFSAEASRHVEGIRHRRKDGTTFEVDIVSRALEFNGRPAILTITTDVSERVKAQRQAQRVFDTSQDVILVVDGYGVVVRVSPSSARSFGYQPEALVGRSASEFIFADDLELTRNEMRAARASGTVRNFKCRYVDRDGKAVSLLWRGVWSEADHQYFFIGRDMTDIEAKDDELRQSQKMEAVGQLTGGVAHDFNNILMVILANVEELLEDGRLAPEQREMLDSIRNSGERAAEMTRRLLAFSRKQRLLPQRTDLTRLVSGIDQLLRRTLGEQIEIESLLAEDLWTTSVDRSQLEAALVNLCVNARDAMPNGGRLLIETANTELDAEYATANPGAVAGQYVMLSVSDTGAGIPHEVLEKVFEPFFTTKEVGKGTGLGLSMVYGFIKQSSGHIKIYSEVGKGTTVKMYLPRIDAPPETTVRAAETLPRGSEHILLVEDDQQVRGTVLSQLRSLGYLVTEAAGGEAGLGFLEADADFDLMLTDVVMPVVDGPRLAGLAAELCPRMKVVFMSGYSEHAAVNHGHVAQDAHILSKPFRKADLARRLREVLDRG
jgi:PAS domain S-box-containing protein